MQGLVQGVHQCAIHGWARVAVHLLGLLGSVCHVLILRECAARIMALSDTVVIEDERAAVVPVFPV